MLRLPGPPAELGPLRALVLANLASFPTMGFRLMHKLLARQKVACSRSQVRRLYQAMGILGKRPAPRARTTDSRHSHPRYPNLVWGLVAERPDQIWAADTLELRVGGRRCFLALVEDLFTRRVVGHALSFVNDALLTLGALEMALLVGTPEIHHSDQGSTYAAQAYVKRLSPGVALSMAGAGRAWENGFAERLNRTFRDEEISRSEYKTLREARESIASYAKLYNERRLHMSLGYIPPMEAMEAYANDQLRGCESTL